MGRKGRKRNNKPSTIELPDGCHHYTELNQVPWDIQNYFRQRFSIFSQYNAGIWMTDQAWFGVTPEPIANKIAEQVAEAAPPTKSILIDCFAGVGGNTIAFAKSGRWTRVYAIEKDGSALACAKHNAEIYGVQEQISWYEGDCFDKLQDELVGFGEDCVIFASPPWGGPGYRSDSVFDLSRMQPYTLSDLVIPFRQLTSDIVLYLPRTSNMRQLAAENKGDDKVTVMQYCMEGASKALCIFYGALTVSEE